MLCSGPVSSMQARWASVSAVSVCAPPCHGYGRRPQFSRCSAAIRAANTPAPGAKPAARRPIQPDPILPDSLFSVATGAQTLTNEIIGPIAVSNDQGRRSVVATRTLTTGELLLITDALVIKRNVDVYPEEEEGAEEQEVDVLENAHLKAIVEDLKSRRYSQRELQWLKTLRRGGAAPSEPVNLAAIMQLDNVDKSSPLPESYTDELLQDMASANTLVAFAEDVSITASVGGEHSPGIVGLWPHQALLNHSCAPSTVSYVVGSKAITRAARPGLLKNAELTRTVLINLVTMPLKQRRDYLQKEHGFKCMCARCKAEEAVAPALLDMVADIHESVLELREDLEQGIDEGDEAKLSSAKDQLAAYIQTLDAAFEQYGPAEQTQVYLQASVFDMYELLFTCLTASQQYEPRLTDLLAGLSGSVFPGSEQHVYWAYMHLRQIEEICTLHVMDELKAEDLTEEISLKAKKMEEYKAADAACFKTNCARYGRITPAMYRRILDTIRQLEDARMEQLQALEQEMRDEQEGEEEQEGAQDGKEGRDDSDVVDVKSEDVTPKASSTAA